MHSRRDILFHWEKAFEQAGVDSPRLSAQVLLAHVLKMARIEMLLNLQDVVRCDCLESMRGLAERRILGEPVAYLVGKKEFYGLEFQVGPEVLIPRPETELMIDHLLSTYGRHESRRVLDIGTGSGALAVTCARFFPQFKVVATDVCGGALRVAQTNAKDHAVQDRILFIQADLVTALRSRQFDIFLANLPYVPDPMLQTMSAEVRNFEPMRALFAGPDGMKCYRALAESLAGCVSPDSLLLCEIDQTQGQAMTELFRPHAREIRIMTDLAGKNRIVVVVF